MHPVCDAFSTFRHRNTSFRLIHTENSKYRGTEQKKCDLSLADVLGVATVI